MQKQTFVMTTTGIHTKNYTIGKLLGKGGFGEVRVATDKRNGQERAIKYNKLNKMDEK